MESWQARPPRGDAPAPPAVVWLLGVRIAPLRFAGRRGYVSALELGVGVGPDRGTNLEGTLLSAGGRW